jgi:hypothetical protein
MTDKIFGLIGIVFVTTFAVTVFMVLLVLFLETWEWINFKLSVLL